MTSSSEADPGAAVSALQSQIAALNFNKDEVDLGDYYVNEVDGSNRGFVNNPSPGVRNVRILTSMDYEKRIMSYTMDVDYRQELVDLVKEMDDFQIMHRSRTLVLASRHLQPPELKKRAVRLNKFRPALTRLTIDSGTSDYLYNHILTQTSKHLRFDRKVIDEYIKDHETSSTGAGFRWGELTSLTDDDWKNILISIRSVVEGLRDSYSGFTNHLPYRWGMRSRSPGLTSPKLDSSYKGTKDRDRIVMFTPGLSMWTAFIPEHTRWYRDCLQPVISDAPVNLILPFLEGGSTYSKASELFAEGKILNAYDGGSWESSVGVILNDAFKPLLTKADGYYHLPSGITLTSMLGSLASIVSMDHLNVSGDDAVVLGDDINYFSDRVSVDKQFGEVIEYQKEDSFAKFVLGMEYRKDPEVPRLQGISLMSDRADRGRPYRMGESVDIRGKHTPRETELWVNMYRGMFGDRTLVEAVSKVTASKFRGGIENLLQQVA